MATRTVIALTLLAACTSGNLGSNLDEVLDAVTEREPPDDADKLTEAPDLEGQDEGEADEPDEQDGDRNEEDDRDAQDKQELDSRDPSDATEQDAPNERAEQNERALEASDLYDAKRLPIYRFTLAPAAREQLAQQPREYVPAELEVTLGDETERMTVGLRLKGEGSFRPLDAKSAFRVKIHEYVRGQRLHGRKGLTLNNMLQDRSLMAERLAYQLFREMGLPAPRVNHAMVFVDDEYYGLYANIETPNEDFLGDWFDPADRTLYEETGRDFDHPEAASSFDRETNEKQPEDRGTLEQLQAACMASDLERARELVDWPKFLLYSALEAAVNQVDGYSYAQSGPNNYRVYDAADGLTFIPWGLDWAFGPVATQDRGLFVDPFWVRKTHGVLMRLCLADDACAREFAEVVESVAERWDSLRLEEHMDRWAEQTREAFEADDRREASHELALQDREVTREFIRGRAEALRQALARHRAASEGR